MWIVIFILNGPEKSAISTAEYSSEDTAREAAALFRTHIYNGSALVTRK